MRNFKIVLFCNILLTALSSTIYSQTLTDSLLLYYTFNGNGNDLSGNGFHSTVHGASLTSDRVGDTNSAFYFDGIDDYISLPNEAKLKPDLPITICYWIKADTLLYEDTRWITTENVYNNFTGVSVSGTASNSGQIFAHYGDASGVGANHRRSKLSSAAITQGNWHHIAVVVRGPLDIDIYIDCVNAGGTYSGTGGSSVAYTNAVGEIGRRFGHASSPTTLFSWFSMDDLAIWNRALSPTEINQVCNYGIPILTNCNSQNLQDSLIRDYKFTGNAMDQSGFGNHAIINGPAFTNDRFGNANNAFYFDGIDDYLQLPNVPKLEPDLPVTISFWIKSESLMHEDNRWFTTDNIYNNYTGISVSGTSSNSGQVSVHFGDGAGAGPSYRRSKNSTSTITLGNWHHIIAVVKGPLDIEIYIDCVNAGGTYSGTGGSSVAYTSANGEVGRSHGLTSNPATNYFWGSIDDLMIWNRPLSYAEIVQVCSDCIDKIRLTTVKGNVSCSGSANGTATVVPIGGQSPYAYLWSNGATTSSISQLGPADYTVTVTDANGCCTSATINITSPPPILLFGLIQNPSAPGLNDGSINLLASGGVNPYSYSWSDGTTTEDIFGIGQGFYFVTTIDKNGCAKIKTFILIDP